MCRTPSVSRLRRIDLALALALALLMPALAASVGCDEEGPSRDDAQPSAAADAAAGDAAPCDVGPHACTILSGGGCVTNDDCQAEEVCRPTDWDVVTGEVVDRGCSDGLRCGVDADCAGSDWGATCNTGLAYCVECLDDTGCAAAPETPVCDTQRFLCTERELERCVANHQCCPEAEACSLRCDDGTCVEGTTCAQDFDCLTALGRYCFVDPRTELGQCRSFCEGPGSFCPGSTECGPDGRCVVTRCETDEDCTGGLPCCYGHCVGSDCSEDADCENVVYGGTCGLDCPNLGMCQDGVCSEQGEEGPCLGGRVCDVDPVAGPDVMNCQDPCQQRLAGQRCPPGFDCDAERGTGLCVPSDQP